VLVGEPTLMQVADAHKSVAGYSTIVHGHAAHSSKPNLGASAVEAACDLVTELYRFADELVAEGDPSGRFDPPASTIHVGTIHGGTARNIMAKLCVFHWEFRALPGVAQNLALQHLEEYAARVVTPKLTRHATDAFIETVTEVEVPGLKPESGSIAETLALRVIPPVVAVAVTSPGCTLAAANLVVGLAPKPAPPVLAQPVAGRASALMASSTANCVVARRLTMPVRPLHVAPTG